MAPQVIPVFGVSGVGKTTACAALAASDVRYAHLVASQLLQEGTGRSTEQLQKATAEEIIRNQDILLRVLSLRLRQITKPFVLLDGNCIIDNGEGLVVIPTEVVRLIDPAGLLLLETSAEELRRRRTSDIKIRPARNAFELETQIQDTRQIVLSYSDGLGLPLQIEASDLGFRIDRALSLLLNPSVK